MIAPSSSVSPAKGTGPDLTTTPPFLCRYRLHVYLSLQTWSKKSLSASLHVVFSRVAPHEDDLMCFLGGGGLGFLLLHHLDLPPPHLIFFTSYFVSFLVLYIP